MNTGEPIPRKTPGAGSRRCLVEAHQLLQDPIMLIVASMRKFGSTVRCRLQKLCADNEPSRAFLTASLLAVSCDNARAVLRMVFPVPLVQSTFSPLRFIPSGRFTSSFLPPPLRPYSSMYSVRPPMMMHPCAPWHHGDSSFIRHLRISIAR
ncbi:hypothetical protein BJX64DRAFT_268945 [Aspergillus heterothallicus]